MIEEIFLFLIRLSFAIPISMLISLIFTWYMLHNRKWKKIEFLNRHVKITRKNSRLDEHGYLRWKHDGYLCHRNIARAQCIAYRYRTDDLRFKDLQVHHVDGNKLNNDPRNLQPLSPREHMIKHGIILEVDGTTWRRVGKEDWIQEEKVTGIRIRNTWIPMNLSLFRGGNVYTKEWFYRKNFRRND